MKNNKTLWTVIIIAVVVIGLYSVMQGPSSNNTGAVDITGNPSTSPTATAVAPVYHKKSTSPAPVVDTRTYSQLVAAFDGKRIQFDLGCQASPQSMSLKNGTMIMLDNRAPQPRTITIGNVSYSVPASGFKLVTLNSPSLPSTQSISCNGTTNVSTILLQALISN